VIVCAYDDNDNLTSKDITLGTGVEGATALDFTYDGLDRVSTADLAEGGSFSSQVERDYNMLGKLEAEKQVIDGYASGAGRTIGYAYDIEGDRSGLTYPVSGDVVGYTRDALDRVDVVSRGGTQVVDYAFNGQRVIHKAYPGSEALYTYDLSGRLTDVHHKDTSSGNTLGHFVYAYDKSHQVTSLDKFFYDDVENTRLMDDTSDLGDQYGYDGAKRLVTVLRGVPTAEIGETIATNISNTDYDDFVEYHYDKTGNRLTREIDGSNDVVSAFNVVNEMTTEGGATLTYHDNGTYKDSSASSKLWSYDHADHLVRYDNAASLTYTWHYDAFGRRIARTRDGTGLDDVRWYYDGEHDVEVVTWDGETETLVRKHVYGETIDELLESVDVTPNPDDTYYAHGDRLGSVMLLADETGAIAESYRYREFGETDVVDGSFAKTSSVASGAGNLKMYTARDVQEEVATFGDPWYHYRARAYRADAGRFVQRDPGHYADGSSLYAYVGNSPALATDPTGRIATIGGHSGQTQPVPGVLSNPLPGLITPTPISPTPTGSITYNPIQGSCPPAAFSFTVNTMCQSVACGCNFVGGTQPVSSYPALWSCSIVQLENPAPFSYPGSSCPTYDCSCRRLWIRCTGLGNCFGKQTPLVLFIVSACATNPTTYLWNASLPTFQDWADGYCQ
jgi:RHS repeat-associated protein